MPYQTLKQLPEGVQNVLPKHAQDIYKEAYNSAYDEYQDPEKRRDDADREEVAHRVAWNAVKQKYKKAADGKWHTKD